LVTAYVKLSG